MMNFDIVKRVSFDVEDDLAYRLLEFVENDMWFNRDDEEDYENLSGTDTRALITAILETALKIYKES